MDIHRFWNCKKKTDKLSDLKWHSVFFLLTWLTPCSLSSFLYVHVEGIIPAAFMLLKPYQLSFFFPLFLLNARAFPLVLSSARNASANSWSGQLLLIYFSAQNVTSSEKPLYLYPFSKVSFPPRCFKSHNLIFFIWGSYACLFTCPHSSRSGTLVSFVANCILSTKNSTWRIIINIVFVV